MEELLQAIANSSIEQQVSLLPQALEYGESGIDFLIDRLNDPELEIRAKAYELLQHNQSQKVQQAIAPGLLFNPGDKIFHIRKSTMWFDDSFYSLYPSSNVDKEKHLVTDNDYINQSFKIISFDRAAYVVTFTPYFINYQQAKLVAESLHNKRISEVSITEFEFNDDQETIKHWCDCYQITQAVNNLQKEKNLKNGLDRWLEIDGMSDFKDNIYWSTVESYLKSSEHLDLLNQLWQDLVGKFAFVGEIIFDKTTYLSIDPYYSQILDYEDRYKYSYGEDVEEFSLSLEETETNYLLTALNSSQLEIRILAYQLLKGINLDKAQQAIYQGVKLNPGDIIYSVYQSGVGYNDQIYHHIVGNPDDVGIEHLRSQITNSHEYELPLYPQRRYCFTDKKQAEEVAETLHRKLIKERDFALEWRKENPNFDLKKWCLDNDIAYKYGWDEFKLGGIDSYDAIFEIKELIAHDEQLYDNLRRSRYIYHPGHMDTWCKDNHLCYEQICDEHHPDYWDNYGKVLDYINLPENIELLSKFWKDGEGNFAFVKEEIVLQKVYIKIGEELHGQAEVNNLFAVSEKDREAAEKLLVELLENSKTQTESKSKARGILQDFHGDESEEYQWENEIPF
ncbi:MAG: hypothetical protein KME09_22840 [Pleurocapsa minor HA4230-MV1]|jgi:hypothetical protein|nr:hypothetical protein [Pleurocapsa minor HA4230-MV1]